MTAGNLVISYTDRPKGCGFLPFHNGDICSLFSFLFSFRDRDNCFDFCYRFVIWKIHMHTIKMCTLYFLIVFRVLYTFVQVGFVCLFAQAGFVNFFA